MLETLVNPAHDFDLGWSVVAFPEEVVHALVDVLFESFGNQVNIFVRLFGELVVESGGMVTSVVTLSLHSSSTNKGPAGTDIRLAINIRLCIHPILCWEVRGN